MEVAAFVPWFFVLLGGDAVGLCVLVLADAGDEPGDDGAGRTGADCELVVLYAADDFGECPVGVGFVNDRELVFEVRVQCREPVWKCDGCVAGFVGGGVAVVDVHHVRGFDEGVVEVLVVGVERVVDFERAAAF